LQAIAPPDSEIFASNEEKGDALFAMELALSLEKLNFKKLRALHATADAANDAPMTHYIEDFLLQEQVEDIKVCKESALSTMAAACLWNPGVNPVFVVLHDQIRLSWHGRRGVCCPGNLRSQPCS
jgi:Ferritin-like domain